MIRKILKVKFKMVKTIGTFAAAVALMLIMPLTASAHCDTMGGPTVADGYKAIESGNINYVLKWVQPEYEKEIKNKFDLIMKMKDLSPEAKEVAEQYFFSELVRVHRAGEGASFDGLKPLGTPIDEVVEAADESIATGKLDPIIEMNEEGLIPDERMAEITERFEKVMSLKDYDVNDLEAGREYIWAYVSFFKFAEGEEEGEHGVHGEVETHEAKATHEEKETHEVKTTHETEVAHKGISYKVKSGDTLWDIAEKYNITYQRIAKDNKIANPNLIYPGQVFVISSK
jgi:nucleoid-associated protein YgaU